MGSNSLKEYLKRYESNNKDEENKKRRKKKKPKPVADGILVMDEDPVWQKPVVLEDENENGNGSSDEERPQVDEDIEVKRMKRLEALRAKRAYNDISEDGSGWVTLPPKRADLDDNLSNEDLSPPRKRASKNDTLTMEADDLSPPRQRRRRSQNSPSPEPRKLGKEVIDLSPPRRGRVRNDTPSPERDVRRPGKVDTDLSPPGQRQRRQQSPLPLLDNDDLSPPRKSKKQVADVGTKEQRKTGLITGREVRDEIARTKKEDLIRFKEMDPSISGRNAEPVYRDRLKGERITKEEFEKSRQKVKEKPKEIKVEWGTGLAQKREADARQQELELEKDKPFARTRDDPELDQRLKEAVRWGDPMAHLVKKKQPEPALPNLGDDEKMKESGFVIPQEIPNHSWIKRALDAAPNRYGIKPGRHWDGVDRSNGYEKELFKRTNEKRATEREAYLWSVSDM